ncbi:MAG: hypothetical protein RL477_76 [Pseudomonadota bacterium]
MTSLFHRRVPLALGLILVSALSRNAVAQDAAPACSPPGAGATIGTTIGDEVVVSASRVPLPARETGSAVTVLTEKDLEQRGTVFLSDILRDVPGVAVGRTGGFGGLTDIRIRGAEANQTLVLIDGMEMNNPASASSFDMGHLLAADIARVEILRGPQSSLYGSDAVGGVINVVTKAPKKGWSGLAAADAGSFATRSGLGNIAYGGENFFFTATRNRLITAGISEANARNGNHEADSYDNGTTHVKAGIRPLENLKFEVVGRDTQTRKEIDDSKEIIGAQDANTSANNHLRNGLIKGDLALLGGNWTHTARAAYANSGYDSLNASKRRTYFNEGTKTKYDYQTSINFATEGSAHAEHTVTLLAESENDQYRVSDRSVSATNYGYVAEYRVSLWDSLFLSGALRYDDNYSLFSDQLTWRGTAAYIHRPWDTRLHGSFGRGVKNPTMVELYGYSSTYTGNPNLRPEELVGMDAGVEKTLLGGQLVTDVTVFRNRFTDYIDGSGSSARNLSGTTQADGVELTAVARPTEQWKLTANYTFTYTQDGNGNKLTRRARHIGGANANYGFTLDGRKANANLGLRYNGTQTDNVYTDSSFSTTRRENLKPFALLNAAFGWEWRENIEIFARAENLLDRRYEEVYGYGTPGRSAFVGLRARF